MVDVMQNFLDKNGKIVEHVPIKKLEIHKKKENIYI